MVNTCPGPEYRADITAGSLRVPESRIVARLLLNDVGAAGFRHAVVHGNVLQARNPATATRLARLLRQRLETMDADLWRLVRDESSPIATHAILAAAVKHSRLLGDFLDLVVHEQLRIHEPRLTRAAWERYLESCQGRAPDMPHWAESTRGKLRRVVFRILAEAGYLDSTGSPKLQPVHVAQPVIRYLELRQEAYVLRCLQGR